MQSVSKAPAAKETMAHLEILPKVESKVGDSASIICSFEKQMDLRYKRILTPVSLKIKVMG